MEEVFFLRSLQRLLHQSSLFYSKRAASVENLENVENMMKHLSMSENALKNAFALPGENYILCIRREMVSRVFIIFNGWLICAMMSCFVKWNIFLCRLFFLSPLLPVYQLKCFSAHYLFNFFDGEAIPSRRVS